MIDKTLLTRYWTDFYIVTQEEKSDFPYANPADAARWLIKAANWIGTFTELLINTSDELNNYKKAFRIYERQVREEDRKLLLKDFNPPAYVLKNAELFKTFVWPKLDHVTKENYQKLDTAISLCKDRIEELELDINNLELILKKLEKRTDWLAQYINWQKFELRSLQQ